MKNIWIYLLILPTLILTNCKLEKDDQITDLNTTPPLPESLPTVFKQSTSQEDITPMPSLEKPQPASHLQNLIENVKEDLAQRLSISTSQVTVVDARDVIWPNSSLGCPQPGMLYTEVLSPGYLILIEINGQKYEYHAGKSSKAFLCENPAPPVPGMPGDT